MKRRSTVLILCAVLLAGAVLRVVGLSFGFPNFGARPDELGIAEVGLRAAGGDFNPINFNYPSLFMYVSGAFYFLYCGTQVTAGVYPSIAACVDPAREGWEPFLIISRALSAFAGVAAVALTFAIGRRFGDDRPARDIAGATAATLLAVNVLHVRDSHFGVTDVAMTTGVLASLWLLIRGDEQPSRGRFLMAGLVGGFAASLKYNAAILAIPVLVSQVFEFADARRAGRRTDVRALLYGGAATVAFLVGTPYALVNRAGFMRDLRYEAEHLRIGHDGIVGHIGWIHHATVTLPLAVGMLALSLAAIGVAEACWRRRRVALIMFAFPAVYYAVAGNGYTVFARYMVPMIPFLCIAAGACVAAVARQGRMGSVVAAMLVAAMALPQSAASATLGRLLQQTDSRVLATEWIWREVPPGASIYLTGSTYARPALHRRGARPEYDIWTWHYGRHRFNGEAGMRGEWPQWIVVSGSPLVAYDSVPPEITAGLARYELQQRVNALGPMAHVYDQQDGWYLPLDGFAGVVRPGPTVSIYRRRD